jgi:hypothetical protein
MSFEAAAVFKKKTLINVAGAAPQGQTHLK